MKEMLSEEVIRQIITCKLFQANPKYGYHSRCSRPVEWSTPKVAQMSFVQRVPATSWVEPTKGKRSAWLSTFKTIKASKKQGPDKPVNVYTYNFWKVGHIISALKPVKANDQRKSYRPITLISLVAKRLEKHILLIQSIFRIHLHIQDALCQPWKRWK